MFKFRLKTTTTLCIANNILSEARLKFKLFLCLLLFVNYSFAQTNKAKQSVKTSVTFVQNSYNAYEGPLTPAIINVKRSSSLGSLSVNYVVSDGDAVPDKDYVSLANKVVFKAGETTASIIVQPLTDYRIKDYRKMRKDRTIKLSLVKNTNYAINNIASTTVNIVNDLSPKNLPSDQVFFSKINLNLPKLEAVKSAVSAGNYIKARKALATYFRQRPAKPMPSRVHNYIDQKTIDDVFNNKYTVFGVSHTFEPNTVEAIDWSFAAAGNSNWTWGFNRFEWWPHLIQGYINNPKANDKYAKRVVDELENWLSSSTLDVTKQQLEAGNRWRNLETGFRVNSTWLIAFNTLKDYPKLSDDIMIDWLKAFYMHQRFLEESAELFTNRGVAQAEGLFACSVFFPEFKESIEWRKLGVTRLENVLKNDVLPDGSYKELSPGYHDLTLSGVQHFYEIAKKNNMETSPIIVNSVQKMFDYMMYTSEPNGLMPFLNDSHRMYTLMDKRLASAVPLFPERKDYQWFATHGKSGTPIKATSWIFPDGGQAIMRSGWTKDDNYLFMDAGPFGTSHGHEDKLSISVDGYGVRHIIDGGPHSYENGEKQNPFREFSTTTMSKSAPIVDNLDQHRRAEKVLMDKKTQMAWYTSNTLDYTAGVYGADSAETMGKERIRPSIITRHILYLKPDVWILVDAFAPLDNQSHQYSTIFQCSDDTLDVNFDLKEAIIQIKKGEFDPFNRVISSISQPSLTISPLLLPNQTMQIFKGQEKPFIAGWAFEKSTSWEKQAIPMLRYNVQKSGNTQMAYVLAATPANQLKQAIKLNVLETSSDTYGLKISIDNTDKILLLALDNKTLTWQNKKYNANSLIIENGKEIIINFKP
ncbi:hypothetical protein A5893_12935 [Pedobacter psychrophilus]|uniref:Heparin-sulfate lyase N-terminal domain-containing protein n=1 Tax=Pedobacter psychrophilus TaxID=1826909 RepID=A0A179DD19_9SPHI|nr:heparinase II/III family protein [Pedobacter psychrophilus]OAQ38937.1 hypothetical protein A5893_12935 [Pedobacter psychrophilus]